MKEYCRKYNFNYNNIPDEALHGFVCALWLEKEYKLKNKNILNSIKNHTLGIKNPTNLDKIIFVSDKISTDRKGNKVGAIRKLAYSNLNETYNKLIKKLVKKLRKKEIKPHINTIESYNQIIKQEIRHKNEFNLKENKRKYSK